MASYGQPRTGALTVVTSAHLVKPLRPGPMLGPLLRKKDYAGPEGKWKSARLCRSLLGFDELTRFFCFGCDRRELPVPLCGDLA